MIAGNLGSISKVEFYFNFDLHIFDFYIVEVDEFQKKIEDQIQIYSLGLSFESDS